MRPRARPSPFETPAAKPLPAPQGEDEDDSRVNENGYQLGNDQARTERLMPTPLKSAQS
jgi:hypothetical protein